MTDELPAQLKHQLKVRLITREGMNRNFSGKIFQTHEDKMMPLTKSVERTAAPIAR
jgi:hypothetical protein